MTGIKHIGTILGIVLLLSSCAAPESMINIEVLEPAAVTYPEGVVAVGYLNRSPVSFNSFKGVNVDSLTAYELFIVDTVICSSIRRGFIKGKTTTHLNYLDDVMYLEARRRDTLYRDSVVSYAKVEEICKAFDLDALITQDYYDFEFDKTRMFNGENLEFVNILIPEARWTLSIPGHSKPLDTYEFRDTLYFGNQSKNGGSKYLTAVEMLIDGSYMLGYAYGKRNIPVWNEFSRIVYTGYQKELRQARSFTDIGDWDKAHHLWSQNLSSDDKELAAKSAHNIAVHYELDDEIEQAVVFSKRAFELWPDPTIESYKQDLELRLLNKQDIYKQLRMGDGQ